MPLPDTGVAVSALPAASSTGALDLLGVQAGVTKKVPNGTYVTPAQAGKVLQASTRATGGLGTVASPWTGWAGVITEAANLRVSGSTFGGFTSLGSGSGPAVHFGAGVYAFPVGGVTCHPYVPITGDHAIFVAASATDDFFIGVGYEATFEGVTFRGGRRPISIASANVDTATVQVVDCEFADNQGAAVYSDDNSASTLLTFERCKFYLPAAASSVIDVKVDAVTMNDCWVSAGSDVVFNVRGGILRLGKGLGVPLNATGTWIRTGATASVAADGFRFGGESGGKTIIESYGEANTISPPRFVVFSACELYAATKFAFKFYALPNVVVVEDCVGLEGTKGFYFDAAITAANRRNFAKFGSFEADGNQFVLPWIEGTTAPLPVAYVVSAGAPVRHELLQTADKVDAWDNSRAEVFLNASGVAGSGVNNPQGVNIQQATCTVANGFLNQGYTAALAALTTGTYTIVYELAVNSVIPIYVILTAADKQRSVHLGRGRHNVSMPFEFEAGVSATDISAYVDKLIVGADFEVGVMRVFKGNVEVLTLHTEVHGAAAPTTLRWYKGDKVFNTSPATAGFMGWVCTVAGTPGTWVTFGPVFATQAANPDTTGATLAALETEVNELKAALRAAKVLTP